LLLLFGPPGNFTQESLHPAKKQGGKVMDKELRKEKGKRFSSWIISLILIFSLTTLCFSLTWAAEEPYPNKPISLIIPMSPGGLADTQAKPIADRLSEILRRPIIMIHKPGAGGTLGASFAARAKPDGYTLFFGNMGNTTLSPLLKKLDYSVDDFILLGIYATGVIYLYVRADDKFKTLEDFVKEAKNRPLTVCSFGRLTFADFIIEAF